LEEDGRDEDLHETTNAADRRGQQKAFDGLAIAEHALAEQDFPPIDGMEFSTFSNWNRDCVRQIGREHDPHGKVEDEEQVEEEARDLEHDMVLYARKNK
jgi:hypothetical protein